MAFKVGCKSPNPAAPPTLQSIGKATSIVDIIKTFCGAFSLDKPERYELYDEESNAAVTEENRDKVLKNGAVFELRLNKTAVADDLVNMLQSNMSTEREKGLRELAKNSEDGAMAKQMVAKGVHESVLMHVEGQGKGSNPTAMGQAIKATYYFFHTEALDINVLTTRPKVVDQLIQYLKQPTNNSQTQQYSLLVMALYVDQCGGGLAHFTSQCNVDVVISYISGEDVLAQENGLALLNAIIGATTGDIPRQHLFQQLDKHRVMPAVKGLAQRTGRNIALSPFCRQQLYTFQVRWLSRLVDRCGYSFNPSDQACIDKLDKLTRVLSESNTPRDKLNNAKKLGFANPKHPERDFEKPPGVLTLDALSEFVDINEQEYQKIVMEQESRPDGYACPVVKMAQSILTMLLELLDAGKEPKEDGVFVPVLYEKSNSFFQVFVKCMTLAARTWREMEARTVDFDKVVHMVRQQILMVLDRKDQVPSYLDEFEAALMDNTYVKMLEAQRDSEKEALGRQMQTQPVKELKERLRQEMQALVKEQRLAHMAEGGWFTPWVKGKFKKDLKFYAMLSQNHKTLKWGEPVSVGEMATPNFSSLKYECDAVDFKVLYTGEDIPEVSQLKKRDDQAVKQTFALLGAGMETHVIFQSSVRDAAAKWMDGIRCLMGEHVRETETLREVESLLKLETRLSLLNLHGIELPDTVEVPKLKMPNWWRHPMMLTPVRRNVALFRILAYVSL
eukprot:TRINITY_DN12022_c3_g5_i1.p1 TRINITY_DN12022_c3_g5~~TRINITY_DN12022_c3_g5_i1.p1  ORF type:complete len:730 (+),score=187.25 TRINITY_DN12022_c3_g5_i1:862-3051(+)